MTIPWKGVASLPKEEGATPFLVTPEEDAAAERQTGLLTGQLGALRAGGGRVFVGLRRNEAIVAVAAFDPDFPGAMPFTASSPALAGSLLEAMHPHARAEHSSVRMLALTEAVADAIREAGGTILLETLRMEGPLST
jgi:hypothetical protein